MLSDRRPRPALPSSRVRATSSGSSQVGVWPTPGRTRKRAPAGRRSGFGGPTQAVELAPGDRHRHVLRVAGRVEDVGAHRPVGAVVAVGVDPAEDQLAAGGGGDPLRVGGEGREHRARRSGGMRSAERDERAQAPGPARGCRARRGPSGARQRPAGESAVTEAAQPARPISSPTQPPSELPATCGRSIPSSAQLVAQRRGEVGGGRLDPGRQRRRGAEAGHVERDHLALGARAAASDRVPDRPRAAEPVDQQQRLARRRSRAHRHPGFANSAWTSPIRRSRKPASEELR